MSSEDRNIANAVAEAQAAQAVARSKISTSASGIAAPAATGDTHSETVRIALAVKAQKAAKAKAAKAKKAKPTKGQTSRPIAISTPSSAVLSGTGVGGALPASPIAQNPLTILAIGAGIFLVVVLLGKRKR